MDSNCITLSIHGIGHSVNGPAQDVFSNQTSLQRGVPLFQIPNGRNQRVDVLACVVKSERGTYCAFDTEPAKDGLRTVMSGAHGDALALESRQKNLNKPAIQYEGQYSSFFAGRADQA